jgi:hypothetical protein
MKNFIQSLWGRYKRWQWNRKCIKYFGCKPETIYLSKDDYDCLVDRLNEPPEYNENLAKLLQKKSPWEEK